MSTALTKLFYAPGMASYAPSHL